MEVTTNTPITTAFSPPPPITIHPHPTFSPDTALALTTTNPQTPKPRRTKPDPIASKSTPPCTECGKRFSSWKALFGHMRCHPERQWRGINPPPNFRRPLFPPPPPLLAAHFTPDEYDVAASLLMLSNSPPHFDCSTCRRSFGSQQALGRHKATHKRNPIEGTIRVDKDSTSKKRTWEEIAAAAAAPPPPPEMVDHKCTVCFRGFSSGQALGGHMRCHWEKDERSYALDLNLPPPADGTEVGSCSLPSHDLDLKLGVV